MRYIIHTTVLAVQERFEPVYVSGFGKDAIFDRRPLGWFIFMKGSYEALGVGMEKPELADGDQIKITVEKA